MTDHQVFTCLLFAVPLEIATLRARGGPTDTDHEACRQFAWIDGEEIPPDPDDETECLPMRRHRSVIGEQGDTMLYGGPNQVRLLADLARVIAVLAFQPGGIRFGGQHWEAI
jgi:hypothetical protein